MRYRNVVFNFHRAENGFVCGEYDVNSDSFRSLRVAKTVAEFELLFYEWTAEKAKQLREWAEREQAETVQ